MPSLKERRYCYNREYHYNSVEGLETENTSTHKKQHGKQYQTHYHMTLLRMMWSVNLSAPFVELRLKRFHGCSTIALFLEELGC